MALHRVSSLQKWCACAAFVMALGGCGGQDDSAAAKPRGVVEAMPATTATADVDQRASSALKQDLATRFSETAEGQAVETGLKALGYECGPNPAAPEERACLKSQREGGCEINQIVRTTPYQPSKAQVIRICETASAPKAKGG